MSIVICQIHLGNAKQTVYVKSTKYSNKPSMETYYYTIKELTDFIAKSPDITEANLMGPQDYLIAIEKEVHKQEILKYNKQKTEFNFI